MRRAAPARLSDRLRWVAVACAALGYLIALGGTSAGQGWRLTPHLAMAHTVPAPALVADAEGEAGLPTLRTLRADRAQDERRHQHGRGAGHTHGMDPVSALHVHPEDGRQRAEKSGIAAQVESGSGDWRSGSALASAGSGPASGQGLHRHGDVIHHHDVPPPSPAEPVVALDKHQIPAPAAVPAPLAARLEARRTDETREARSLTVETPPPVGRS